MKITVLSGLVLVIFSVATLTAQEIEKMENEKKLDHYIGIGAGFTSGFGLSYRMSYGKFGAQLNFAPVSFNDNRSLFSSGILAKYRVSESRITNLHIYGAGHFLQIEDYDQIREYFNTGIGFNFEFNSTKRIVFNWKFGIGAYNYFKRLSLTGEAGIHYRL